MGAFIFYWSLRDLWVFIYFNLELIMTNITLISGGALGADSVWSYIAEKHGIKTIHLIGSGLSRPTGGIDDNRIREQRSGINQAITYEQTAEAIKGFQS